MTQQRIALGIRGEDLATDHYKADGWEILERNWRCRTGELDIIAQKNTSISDLDGNCKQALTVVFCEVKTRSNFNFGSPAEAVTSQKRKRIRRLACLWLSAQKSSFAELRFDVAEVIDDEVEVCSYD